MINIRKLAPLVKMLITGSHDKQLPRSQCDRIGRLIYKPLEVSTMGAGDDRFLNCVPVSHQPCMLKWTSALGAIRFDAVGPRIDYQ
jgi:hypothetical protein